MGPYLNFVDDLFTLCVDDRLNVGNNPHSIVWINGKMNSFVEREDLGEESTIFCMAIVCDRKRRKLLLTQERNATGCGWVRDAGSMSSEASRAGALDPNRDLKWKRMNTSTCPLILSAMVSPKQMVS